MSVCAGMAAKGFWSTQKSILLLALSGIVLGLSLVPIDAHTRLGHLALETSHFIGFFLISMVVLTVLKHDAILTRRATIRAYLSVFLALLISAAGIEGLQSFFARSASLEDWLSDILGIMAGLSAYAVFDRVLWKGINRLLSPGIRIVLAGLAAILLWHSVSPLGTLALAYIERNRHFPVLISFDSGIYQDFMLSRGADLALVEAQSEWPTRDTGKVARLTFDPKTQWPGITLRDPFPDWRGFMYLELDVFLPTAQPENIVLRIDDCHHTGATRDRFQKRYELIPGPNLLKISLSEVETSLSRRRLDLNCIRRIIIFMPDESPPSELLLARIRLSER